MLKVAVIGMGGIGNTHASVYQANENVELVGVCDMVPELANKAADKYGVPAFNSVADLIKNAGIDTVSVATAGDENGGAHYDPVMECLEAGLNVLCEKPISNNIEHAREMVKKADEKEAYFGINLNHRFVPPAIKAKEWVTDGKLGDLLLINMTMWIGNPKESSEWFHARALHPHSLDVMRYYCGPVRRVHAFFNKAPGRFCYSNLQMNLEFESGAVGHLTGSYDTNPRHNLERCEVMGTEGRFVLDNCYQELTLFPRHSEELTVIRNSIMGGLSGFSATFENRINTWVDEVNRGIPRDEIDASGKDGLAVQEIIEGAIRSHESGRAEELPIS